MQVNWSLILNILLLVGVMIAIVRTLKARRHTNLPPIPQSPSIGLNDKASYDDIISIRKVSSDSVSSQPAIDAGSLKAQASQVSTDSAKPAVSAAVTSTPPTQVSVMMFLLAKENRQLAGYELLQTVLTSGLRFGEGNIFHRHQSPSGHGPVLFSLAAATSTGTFDMQNIGAFTVRGLCLFMQASGNPTIDAERFDIMLETAKQISEALDTHLLDDQRKPLSDASIERYHRALNLEMSLA